MQTKRQMLDKELTAAIHAAHEAGTAILRIAQEHHQTAVQADRTVVTQADIEADRILQRHLRGGFPGYGWLSEETQSDASRLNKNRVWIVDPMDGTREFVMKVPEFVVSIALVERGEPILAVIYNPTTGDLHEAIRGGDAKCNDRPIHCDHKFAGKAKVEVSRSDLEKGRFTGYEPYVELRPVGSIAYKLARLATGLTDATLSLTPKNEWDIAAGVLLVRQAGGRINDLRNQCYTFNRSDTLLNGVVAASDAAYDAVLSVVRKVSPGQ